MLGRDAQAMLEGRSWDGAARDVGLVRIPRGHDDALWRRRAVVLAYAAAGAALFLHHHAIAVQLQRRGTHGALINADRAVLADRADARLLAPASRAHVDVLDRDRPQG